MHKHTQWCGAKRNPTPADWRNAHKQILPLSDTSVWLVIKAKGTHKHMLTGSHGLINSHIDVPSAIIHFRNFESDLR